MALYAILQLNVVTALIETDTPQGGWVLITPNTTIPLPGWLYIDGRFVRGNSSKSYVWITRKAFYRRFLVSEREALQNILATGTQTQKNKLNAFLDYIKQDDRVELDDQYIIDSVNLMETAGVIGSGRATQILTNPISSTEQ